MVNASKAFEVSDNGVAIGDLWVGGGAATPTHSASIGSRYFKTDGSVYLQAGPGTTDWIIVSPPSGTIVVSPVFIFGRSGSTPSNTWLLNDAVPSNITGVPIISNSSKILRVGVSNENSVTWTVEIYEHDQTTYTLLYTAAVTPAAKQKTFESLNISLTKGKQLAAKMSSSSPNASKNPRVYIVTKGDIV